MTRYIDADALWAKMKEYYEKRVEEANMTGDRTVGVTWHDAVILIKSTPTIDAVPVIRCKDCMFYQTDKGGWCLDHDDDVLWHEDSYCSRAVRKKYEFGK